MMRRKLPYAALPVATLIVSLCLACGPAAAEQNDATGSPTSPVQDPKHVELLYSGDDRICGPLATLYDELNHKPSNASYWERDYAGAFRSAGFFAPKGTLVPAAQGGQLASETYEVEFGDSRSRSVFVQDNRLGRDMFTTNVWILKPGARLRFKRHRYSFGDLDRPAPDVVEFAALFGGSPGHDQVYHYVKAPYLFEKIESPAERALPLAERLRQYDLGLSAETIQRLFLFNRRMPVFTARPPGLGAAIAYTYRPAEGVDDLCYFASAGTIAFSDQQKATLGKGRK